MRYDWKNELLISKDRSTWRRNSYLSPISLISNIFVRSRGLWLIIVKLPRGMFKMCERGTVSPAFQFTPLQVESPITALRFLHFQSLVASVRSFMSKPYKPYRVNCFSSSMIVRQWCHFLYHVIFLRLNPNELLTQGTTIQNDLKF